MSFYFPTCVTSRSLELPAPLVHAARSMLSSIKGIDVHTVRRELRIWVLSVLIAGVMTGCALSPQGSQDPSSSGVAANDQSEVTPADETLCPCDLSGGADYFDAALQHLALGDYEAARASLARHAGSEADQASQEASAGLDLVEAIAAQNLEPDAVEASPEGARASVLRMLLALIDELEDEIAALQANNAELAVELEKREEALKRLRELTLGQPES